MRIIGIDPGYSGAVVMLERNKRSGNIIQIQLEDMPVLHIGKKTELDLSKIRSLLSIGSTHVQNFQWMLPHVRPITDHVFIEKCQSMPGQGIAGTAAYMKGFGMLIGLCYGMELPITLVHPATWKRAMMKDMPREKSSSILRAEQLFPEIDFPRKKDHGKADALLIAYWGSKQLIGK